MTAPADRARKLIASNRKAFHEFHVLERIEAGIELRGTEVKSIRAGQISLAGGFARPEAGGVVLRSVNVPVYEYGGAFNHDPLRPRRLLLHRREIEKLRALTEQQGGSAIPLEVYLRNGRVKVELGLCRGKRVADKRETLRRRTAAREAEREVARATRR
jgi:SsrA-binding protein